MCNLNNIKDLNILVVGFGRSGIAALQVLIELGANVKIQDSKKESELDSELLDKFRKKGVECYFGGEWPDFKELDMIVLSPGVSPEIKYVVEAKKQGVEITGEIELAYRIGKGNYVAITGTNGKTTTTTLVGEIFKKAKMKTDVVGNIGTAVIGAAAHAEENEWLITECSSFQLETTKYFRPLVSAILNLTPDHLNRHHTMENYVAAKAKIFENQRENNFLVINYDDKLCLELSKKSLAKVVPFSVEKELNFGAYINKDNLVINDGKNIIDICKKSDIRIIGKHNLQNVLAAAGISYFCNINIEDIRRGIKDFNGVEHRIEYCGEHNGVKYYNDSKGTNTDAAITAINAIEKNIILIAGGDGKGQDFTPLTKSFKGRIKELILLGRDAPIIEKAARDEGFNNIHTCNDMEECIDKAYKLARKGDCVLLSPACASWDMYNNYEERGNHFKNLVKQLGE